MKMGVYAFTIGTITKYMLINLGFLSVLTYNLSFVEDVQLINSG